MFFFLSLFPLLVSVGFYTLLERKTLGYIMLRRGPNKPSLSGLIVPFADAAKLLAKPFIFPLFGRRFLILFSCTLSLVIPSILWAFVVWPSSSWDWSHTILSLVIWISISVYSLLAAGWGSNSKYSTLGGTRAVAQCISYEVCFSLLLLCFCMFSSFNLLNTQVLWYFLVFCHLVLFLFLVALAETNRSPFDFVEGESELVSGYNVEFSGPGFVVLFLSEYLSILFMSFLTASLACGSTFVPSLLFCIFFAFGFIWVRGTLPRFRYDSLISLC